MDTAAHHINEMRGPKGWRSGEFIKNWRLEHLAGLGGIAEVYSAVRKVDAMRAAVKVVHGRLVGRPEVRASVLHEAAVTGRVQHPGVATVFDQGVTGDGCAYVVLEFLAGEDLEQRQSQADHLMGVRETLTIADQVLDILVAVHEAGIVHRDVKPENVFLTHTGEVKLLDFGIALADHSAVDGHDGGHGLSFGTPAYMPPEQAWRDLSGVSARSDIWALGATMYWLLSGRFVRAIGDSDEALQRVATAKVPSLGTVADVPDYVVRLVDRALAFRSEDRWRDASEMQAAVREALERFEERSGHHKLPQAPSRHPLALPPPLGLDDSASADAGFDQTVPASGERAAASKSESEAA